MSKLLVVLAALLVCAQAISISWTGYAGDNQWTNKINWSPDQVPSTGDDVTIASGTVLVTIATGVNSLVMGTAFGEPANLTVFQSFFIGTGGMQVGGNGNLFVNAGTAQITGQVTIEGSLNFQSGALSGTWQITSKGVANLAGGSQKAFIGCQFTSNSPSFVFGGVMALNQSSQVVIGAGTTLMTGGDVSIQAQDSSQVLLDTSAGTWTYTGNGDLQIQAPVKIGKFNFQGGNLTIFDTLTFQASFKIPSGSYVATVGSAVVDMTAGVSGSGVLTSSGSTLALGKTTLTGALNIVGGNTTFSASGSNVSILTISGGYAIVNHGVMASQLNFMSGNLIGSSSITAVQLLSNTQGFNLGLPVTVTGQASLGGLLAFAPSGMLTISSTGKINVLSSLVFTGTAGQSVINNGAFAVSAPVTFQTINLGGTGTSTVTSTLSIQAASVTQMTVALGSAGVFKGSSSQITTISKVTGSPKVKAVIGTYTLYCKGECDNVSTSAVPTSSFHFTASS